MKLARGEGGQKLIFLRCGIYRNIGKSRWHKGNCIGDNGIGIGGEDTEIMVEGVNTAVMCSFTVLYPWGWTLMESVVLCIKTYQ